MNKHEQKLERAAVLAKATSAADYICCLREGDSHDYVKDGCGSCKWFTHRVAEWFTIPREDSDGR